MIRLTEAEAETLAQQCKEDYEWACRKAREEGNLLDALAKKRSDKRMNEPSHPEAIRTAILHGAPCTQEEYISVRDALPKPPEKRYPLGIVLMWSIAALSLGFAFAGLLLGCSGTPKADNYCCYGGKAPSCVDAFQGCTFHADDSEDAGGSTCGTMTCD